MKICTLFCFAFLYSASLNAQLGVETQIGGSNFLGLSANAFYEFSLTHDQRNTVTSTLGLGILEPDFGSNFIILHQGLNYRRKRWGAGAEYSIFTGSFGNRSIFYDFVDVIAYPNLNYTILAHSGWMFKASLGAYFAFSKDYRKRVSDAAYPYRFEGDVIPGAGLSFGYRF